jgi:hypothetical protein
MTRKKKEHYKQLIAHEEGGRLSKRSFCERFFKYVFAFSTYSCKYSTFNFNGFGVKIICVISPCLAICFHVSKFNCKS